MKKSYLIQVILLFFIGLATIIAVAILINPYQIRNLYFYITVGWLIVLLVLNLFASIFIYISDSKSSRTVYGILPPLNSYAIIYSLFSATFLIPTWYVNDSAILSNWHLVVQIILLSIFSTFVVFMYIAAKTARIDDVIFPLSKVELVKALQAIQSTKDLSEEKRTLLKELIEIVRYSIPHLSKLNSKDNYEKLTIIFKNKNIQNKDELDIEEIENAIFLAKNC